MWITGRRSAAGARAALLLAGLALLASCASWAASAPARSLNNEEIVRMTARGMAPSEIIRAIREAPATSFDLDPEVVAEMRAAGVVEAVIEVMGQVQRDRMPAPQTAPAPAATASAEGTIDLIFEKGPGASRKGALRLPLEPAEVVFYLICLEPTHVPDFWMTKTPLAEGFPRHHLLWMQEAPPAAEAGGRDRHPAPRVLQLPRTEGQTAIRAQAGVHQIEVGLAARDDRKIWAFLGSARTALEIRAGEVTRLVVRAGVVRVVGKPPLALQIVEPPQPPAPDPADIKR